jgi:phytoene desaturase
MKHVQLPGAPGGSTGLGEVSSAPPIAGPTAPHAIVIGTGFGGLGAAIRLSCRGYRVTVLEKLDAPGGRAYVWRQDGFTFDAGPTIVTAPFFLEELWQMAGRRFADDVSLVPVEPFYRVRFDDGDTFDYTNDLEKVRAQIARISPRDVAGYDKLMQESELAYKLGFEKLGSIAYNEMNDLMYAVPFLVKLRGWRSLHALVAGCMKHPKLRTIFTLQSLLIGGNPFSVTSVYSLIHALERQWGVHWAKGGTGAIVQAMVRLLQSRRVDIRCNAEVQQILVEPPHGKAGKPTACGVRLASGETLPASIVVSNADTSWTYKHLIAPEHRRHWTDRKIARQKMSMSLFVWYFGLNRRYDAVPHHMMVLGPRYEGLLTDIFKRHVLADDFSREAIPTTRWRQCRTSIAAPTGPRWPRRIARPWPSACTRPCCRASSSTSSPRASPRRSTSTTGCCRTRVPPSAPNRSCCKARTSAPTTAARTSPSSTWSAPAHTRAPACRAC